MKIPMNSGQIQAVKQDPLPFSKMAGGGNDFVVIDNRTGRVEDAVELTRRICTPHLSVGADGVVLIEGSALANFRMRYLNADGSRGEAGIVGAEVDPDGVVTLSLSSPSDFRSERPLRVGDQSIHGSSMIVGVPHYVIFLKDDLWSQDIVPLGRAIREHAELQPKGANVNFVVVRDTHSIDVRTYERGVEAETLSCGSGVVAAVSACALFDRVKSPVLVLTRSGITLEVSFSIDNGEIRDIRLRGDARLVYRSALTAETIAGFDPDFVRNPAEKALSAGS